MALRKAVWLWTKAISEIGADKIIELCRDLGINDVLVLVKSISGETFLDLAKELLSVVNPNNIRIHAWIVSFYDKKYANGSVDPGDSTYRRYLLDFIKKVLETEVNGKVFSGIHLDYIRYYHGSKQSDWKTVSSFVKSVRKLIDTIDPNRILSMASKAEDYESKEGLIEKALLYGQNYMDLRHYVDIFVPMTYYLDYNISPEKVPVAAKWVKEITGKTVYAGIQLHPGEHPQTRGRIPTIQEIQVMLEGCSRNGIDGVCFFRYKMLHERAQELKNIITKY